MSVVHDISSPRAPPRYHRAMLAYHTYLLNPGSDFLSFWYDCRDEQEDEDLPSSSSLEILRGLEVFRDRIVGESRRGFRQKRPNPKISVRFLLEVLADIRSACMYTEASAYWSTVSESTDASASTITLSELSEAVLAFLNSISVETKQDINSADTSARVSPRDDPQTAVPDSRFVADRWCACTSPGDCLLS